MTNGCRLSWSYFSWEEKRSLKSPTRKSSIMAHFQFDNLGENFCVVSTDNRLRVWSSRVRGKRFPFDYLWQQHRANLTALECLPEQAPSDSQQQFVEKDHLASTCTSLDWFRPEASPALSGSPPVAGPVLCCGVPPRCPHAPNLAPPARCNAGRVRQAQGGAGPTRPHCDGDGERECVGLGPSAGRGVLEIRKGPAAPSRHGCCLLEQRAGALYLVP